MTLIIACRFGTSSALFRLYQTSQSKMGGRYSTNGASSLLHLLLTFWWARREVLTSVLWATIDLCERNSLFLPTEAKVSSQQLVPYVLILSLRQRIGTCWVRDFCLNSVCTERKGINRLKAVLRLKALLSRKSPMSLEQVRKTGNHCTGNSRWTPSMLEYFTFKRSKRREMRSSFEVGSWKKAVREGQARA